MSIDQDTPVVVQGDAALPEVSPVTPEQADSPILSVDQILSAKDLKEETLDVPEWGGSVVIRSFSKKGQQEVREAATVDEELDNDRLEMFMFLRGVINPVFTDDQYELLRTKNAGVIDRILTKIMSLSGMTQEAMAAANAQFPAKP